MRAGGAAVGGGGAGRAGAAAGGGGGGGVGRGGGAAAGGGGGGAGRGAAAGGGGGGAGRGGAAAGGGGGGGAGRGGAAAGGGGAAGALGAAAGGGAPGVGLLGLPSGPTSSLAWATTSGADCACDVEVASCATVKAVVASSTMRRFVMMSLVPGKRPGSNGIVFIGVLDASQRVIIRPDCGRLQMARWFLFHRHNGLHVPLFIACSDGGLTAGRARSSDRSRD